MVHKAGLQVPHWGRWQEIQCLDCQVQPHGMLQKTSWPSCVNSASQISVLSAAAECEDNATRLSPAVSSLLVIPPAAVLKSCCARTNVPAVVLGLGLAVLLRQ